MKETDEYEFTPADTNAIGEALSPWLPAPTAHDTAVAAHARTFKQAQERADAALRRAGKRWPPKPGVPAGPCRRRCRRVPHIGQTR